MHGNKPCTIDMMGIRIDWSEEHSNQLKYETNLWKRDTVPLTRALKILKTIILIRKTHFLIYCYDNHDCSLLAHIYVWFLARIM